MATLYTHTVHTRMLRFHFAYAADTSTSLHLRGHRAPRNDHAIKIAALSRAYLAEHARTTTSHARISFAHRIHEPLEVGHSAADAARTRREHQIAAPKRQRGGCWRSRPPNGAQRRCPSCQHVDAAAASRHSLAATTCQQTCRMLDSSAEVSLSRSGAVTRKALPQRGAQERSRQGGRRPSDIVRATSGRPLPARLTERQYLLGARDRCPCHLCAFDAIHVAPGWGPGDEARLCPHIFSPGIP